MKNPKLIRVLGAGPKLLPGYNFLKVGRMLFRPLVLLEVLHVLQSRTVLRFQGLITEPAPQFFLEPYTVPRVLCLLTTFIMGLKVYVHAIHRAVLHLNNAQQLCLPLKTPTGHHHQQIIIEVKPVFLIVRKVLLLGPPAHVELLMLLNLIVLSQPHLQKVHIARNIRHQLLA
jgi:hypothetical protein